MKHFFMWAYVRAVRSTIIKGQTVVLRASRWFLVQRVQGWGCFLFSSSALFFPQLFFQDPESLPPPQSANLRVALLSAKCLQIRSCSTPGCLLHANPQGYGSVTPPSFSHACCAWDSWENSLCPKICTYNGDLRPQLLIHRKAYARAKVLWLNVV